MENKVIAKEYIDKNYVAKEKIINKINEINSKMAEQLYIIKEFGEHEGNRKKITMYKEQRDILGELLEDK